MKNLSNTKFFKLIWWTATPKGSSGLSLASFIFSRIWKFRSDKSILFIFKFEAYSFSLHTEAVCVNFAENSIAGCFESRSTLAFQTLSLLLAFRVGSCLQTVIVFFTVASKICGKKWCNCINKNLRVSHYKDSQDYTQFSKFLTNCYGTFCL